MTDVVIVEVELSHRQVVSFQGLLQGEDGLAVMRCRDPEKRKQQLWTTYAQREALYDWLESLPETLKPRVVSEKRWSDEHND